jgi:hypothetical protein
MKYIQYSNQFNGLDYSPIPNNNYHFLFPQATISKTVENKPNLFDNFHSNYNLLDLINFPFFNNNNNDKDFIKYIEQNPIGNQIYFNYNLFGNFNSIFNPIGQVNQSFLNNNSIFTNLNNFNNNNSLFNIYTPYISRAFDKNHIKHNNDFQSPKSIPQVIKLNNKNNILINEDEELDSSNNNTLNSTRKKCIFKSISTLRKKRGRFSINQANSKRVHSSNDFDNVYRKIQVHFLNFIVQFINEIIYNLIPNERKLHFLYINYNIKKIVNHNTIMSLKEKKIKDILIMTPSSKYKFKNSHNNNDNYNEQVYNELNESSDIMKNIFDMNYIEFFNKYYTSKTRNILIEGKEINFTKAKFFCDLLKANPTGANRMKDIAKSHYNIRTGTLFVINK